MAERPPKLYTSERRDAKSPKSKKKSTSWLSTLLSLFNQKNKKDPSQKKRSSNKISIRWMLFKLFLTLGAWIFSFGVLAILWFSYDLPDADQLMISSRKPGVTIQAQDGTVIGTYGDLFEEMVKLSDLPPYVPQALMAVEDRRFYSHFGVDLIGLMRAAYTNYRAGRVVQGGSTVTQQLAKNFLQNQGKYSVHDRSLRRKIQEVILAVWLELKFTKEQILTMYLNRVYFGAGTFGIEAASQKYYHKPAKYLTVYEAATIAGLLKAPSRYSPRSNPERSNERATLVLTLMQEAGYIPSAKQALTQKHDDVTENYLDLKSNSYFGDWIYEQIPSLIGSYDEDLVVVTTLDPFMQQQAEIATKAKMEELGKKFKTTEMALVAMTPNGAIRAMIGGMSYGKGLYNRATQALRQPGSAFKPFVYLAGLESGLTPDTMISDEPFSIGGWTPKNFRTYKPVGEITMAEGLKKSVNAVTVHIAAHVGGAKIASVARRLGITSPMITDLSICLGAMEVTLLELTSAYASFANNGNVVTSYGIKEIRNKKGDILYEHQDADPIQVIKPQNLHDINRMLQNAVAHGTGRAAQTAFPTGGKTGSNGDKDAWFVGYTSNFVVGVWTGNDNNAPMIKNSTGGRIPAQAFGLFMKPVLEANPPKGAIVTAPIATPNEGSDVSVDEGIIIEGDSGSLDKTEVIEDTTQFDQMMNEVAQE